MNLNLNKAIALKNKLIDFVYDAEDDIAIALEAYSATKSKTSSYSTKQQSINTDLFALTETVNNTTVLDLYQQQTELEELEQKLLSQWDQGFVGLFEIKAIEDQKYLLKNWLTAKTYTVYAHEEIPEKELSRWQPGEIILTIIAPLDEIAWFFFSDRIIKGQLSQPKLAVAIGEFRDGYPDFLYADASELLEQAWESVQVYHDEFVEFFGSDRLTLPGYELNKRIQELQQRMSKQRLADLGIDDEKSLAQLLKESGATEEEFAENASNLGFDAEVVAKLIKNKDKLSMVAPKVDLPLEIKQAETVTVFSHPKWGQMFLPTYEKFAQLLVQNNSEESDRRLQYIQKYLTIPEANYYVWQQLQQEHPEALNRLLQEFTKQADFELAEDLESLLLEYNKSPIPPLPVMASVPIHLNNLFETALAQVQKTKTKKKKKAKKGFVR